MRLMYPHPVDRYRIIRLLVRNERRNYRPVPQVEGIGQKELARLADVSQSTVSRLEHLAEIEKPLQRRDILKVLTWGLALDQERIDAILWLYDGQPLTKEEIERYVRGYHREAQVQSYTFERLRDRVLELLEELLQNLWTLGHQSESKVVRSGQDIESNEAILKMEEVPGQRLLVRRIPSYLTYPLEILQSGELFADHVSEDMLPELVSLQVVILHDFVCTK